MAMPRVEHRHHGAISIHFPSSRHQNIQKL
jgi:hypothetical protein